MAWPNSQARRVELVIQNAQVDGSGTHSDFPVLITRANLPDEICSPTDSNRAQSDGGDIRAAADNACATQLPIEIVKWGYDSGDGVGDAVIEIWVKRDVATASDTSIWLGYNTAGTTSADAESATYGANNVWSGDGSTWEYKFVHHLETGLLDSTANSIDATDTGTTDVAGTFGRARDWQSGTDKLDLGDVTDTTDVFSGGGTVQAIFTPGASPDNSFPRIFDKLTVGWWMFDNSGSDWSMRLYRRFATGVERGDWDLTSRDIAEGSQHIAAVKYDDGSVSNNPTMVINGTVKTVGSGLTETTTPVGSADSDTGNNFYIGNRPFDSGRSFDGTIDEFRVADREHANDWLTTEYNMMSAPATFVIEGTPEATAAAATLASMGLLGVGI